MLYFLLFISVILDTLKNTYYNFYGKSVMKESNETLLFNMISCVGAVIYFLGRKAPFQISQFSIIMAVAFSLVTVGAQYFSLLATSVGPMSYSVLFTYLSMIIPTLFGVIYYHQTPSILQIIGLILMGVTFVLSCELKGEGKVSIKWLIIALFSFLSWGLVGICQQLHQNSVYAEELNGFLLWSFIFSTALFGILYFSSIKRKQKLQKHFKLSSTVIMVFTGIAIGAINEINLYLSGAMPGFIFFPIVNGGVIILSGLAAIFIFREKLSKQQKIGLISGIISVLCLGM